MTAASALTQAASNGGRQPTLLVEVEDVVRFGPLHALLVILLPDRAHGRPYMSGTLYSIVVPGVTGVALPFTGKIVGTHSMNGVRVALLEPLTF